MSKNERRKKKVRTLASEKKLSYQQASQQLEAEKLSYGSEAWIRKVVPTPARWKAWCHEVGQTLRSLSVARQALTETNGLGGHALPIFDVEPQNTFLYPQNADSIGVVNDLRRAILPLILTNPSDTTDPVRFAKGLAQNENKRFAQLLGHVRKASKVTVNHSLPLDHATFCRHLVLAEVRRPRALNLVAPTEVIDRWKLIWGDYFQPLQAGTQVGTVEANGTALKVYALDALTGDDLFVLPDPEFLGVVGHTPHITTKWTWATITNTPFGGLYMGLLHADLVCYLRSDGGCVLPRAWTLTEEA